MKAAKQITMLSLLVLMNSAWAEEKAPKPEDKPGYDKTKDVGTKAP